MDQIACVSLPQNVQYGCLVQVPQLADVLHQIERFRVRLFNVVVVHAQIFAIVLELNQRFARVGNNTLGQFGGRRKTSSVDEPHLFARLVAIFLVFVALKVGLDLEGAKKKLHRITKSFFVLFMEI